MPTLEWIGKSKVINHHQEVPFRVLERKYSFDENGQHNEDNGSENMIIRGDNLEALKALLPRYEGRIKCIYIDPPYNTGNEGWVYNDNVNDPKILRWLGELVGKAGEDLTRHDKWLCMMYPRLKLLYKLLSDDGAIFISLDDNEIFYLRSIMDEIFGASNFTAQITLLCNPKGRSQDKNFATCHEYLLVYTKSAVPAGWFSVEKDDAKIEKDYKLSDAGGKYRLLELRNTHREFGKENRPNLWYPIYANADDGTVSLEKDEQHNIEIYPTWPDGYKGCWTWGTELASKSTQLLVAQKKAGAWKIYRKSYAATDGETVRQKLFTIWNNPQFFTEKGQVAFGQIFPGANKNDFPQPKSVEYVMEAIRTITHDDDIVLDSFAGSGTTGHGHNPCASLFPSVCNLHPTMLSSDEILLHFQNHFGLKQLRLPHPHKQSHLPVFCYEQHHFFYQTLFFLSVVRKNGKTERRRSAAMSISFEHQKSTERDSYSLSANSVVDKNSYSLSLRELYITVHIFRD